MQKAVVRVVAEARFVSGPPMEPSHHRCRRSCTPPTSLRQKLQKRRGSGSFLKFWLVSESSVVTPSQRAVPSWGRERNECTHTGGRLRDPA